MRASADAPIRPERSYDLPTTRGRFCGWLSRALVGESPLLAKAFRHHRTRARRSLLRRLVSRTASASAFAPSESEGRSATDKRSSARIRSDVIALPKSRRTLTRQRVQRCFVAAPAAGVDQHIHRRALSSSDRASSDPASTMVAEPSDCFRRKRPNLLVRTQWGSQKYVAVR